jgi:hypothetical protein
MIIRHSALRGFGAEQAKGYCLPVDNGYAVMKSNPYCQNGWGWLKEGECGCYGGATLAEPAAPGWNPEKRGCSVKCMAKGPNDCPNCPKPINWKLYGGIGLAAVAAYFFLGRK